MPLLFIDQKATERSIKMSKKIPLWIAISVTLLFGTVVMLVTVRYVSRSYTQLQTVTPTNNFYSKLDIVAESVKNDFYKDIDETKLQDAMIEGYLSGLGDDYAEYFSAEETAAIDAEGKGQVAGMGVNYIINPKTGYMYIRRVHEKSPAFAAGIEAGESIAAVNGTTVTAENYEELLANLRKNLGQPAEIKVIGKNGKSRTVSVAPAAFEGQSVWVSKIGDTAYIVITGFDDTTAQQLREAFAKVADAKNVIFDLRGNPGGTVRSVCACLDYLLPSGELLVATYKDGSSKVLQYSDAEAALNIPAVVLVDSKTASSGEVFTLAMRDIYNAKIVGETTFGKGVMQNNYDFEDGSSYKFTVATVTSQSRVEYNGLGIVPDVTVKLSEEEKETIKMTPVEKDKFIAAAMEVFEAAEVKE